IIKIVVFNEELSILNLTRDKLSHLPELNIVLGSKNGLDINAFGVNKGKALLEYAYKLNIRADEIIAMGDSENDLSMLEVVGMPITLENGSSLVKEKAKYITKSNDEAGVAYALKHFFNELF
ncbi:MAG: HAD hydrolase family protein, partial [Bacilli bacterium]